MYQYLKTLRLIILAVIAISTLLLVGDALSHPIDWLGIACILIAGCALYKLKI